MTKPITIKELDERIRVLKLYPYYDKDYMNDLKRLRADKIVMIEAIDKRLVIWKANWTLADSIERKKESELIVAILEGIKEELGGGEK